jgi:hypothetical protein
VLFYFFILVYTDSRHSLTVDSTVQNSIFFDSLSRLSVLYALQPGYTSIAVSFFNKAVDPSCVLFSVSVPDFLIFLFC